jgi:SpoIIAA-like
VLSPGVASEGLGRIYLDTPHMGIRGDHLWVFLEIRARSSSEDFREGMEMCIHALDVTKATRLLLDLRKMRLLLVEDERWLAQDLLPRIAKTTLKRMAIVKPENALARAILADLARPRPTGAESKHCETFAEAKDWLAHPGER